ISETSVSAGVGTGEIALGVEERKRRAGARLRGLGGKRGIASRRRHRPWRHHFWAVLGDWCRRGERFWILRPLGLADHRREPAHELHRGGGLAAEFFARRRTFFGSRGGGLRDFFHLRDRL